MTRYLKSADALMSWAHKEGLAGRDYRATRDAAADAGSLAHAAVEGWIRGKPFAWPDDNENVQRARKAFEAFLRWATQTKLEIVEPERSLVSERHRFGGTLDAILIDHHRAVADWKSSNGLYPDMLAQIGAYGILLDEADPSDPITGYHLIRFDKEYGDFHHHYWPELDAARAAFLKLREVYDLEAELRRRVR